MCETTEGEGFEDDADDNADAADEAEGPSAAVNCADAASVGVCVCVEAWGFLGENLPSSSGAGRAVVVVVDEEEEEEEEE